MRTLCQRKNFEEPHVLWRAALIHYLKQGQRHQVTDPSDTLYFHSYLSFYYSIAVKMVILKAMIIILFLNN